MLASHFQITKITFSFQALCKAIHLFSPPQPIIILTKEAVYPFKNLNPWNYSRGMVCPTLWCHNLGFFFPCRPTYHQSVYIYKSIHTMVAILSFAHCCCYFWAMNNAILPEKWQGVLLLHLCLAISRNVTGSFQKMAILPKTQTYMAEFSALPKFEREMIEYICRCGTQLPKSRSLQEMAILPKTLAYNGNG